MARELMSYRLNGCETFACDVCGDERPQNQIAVTRHDVSEAFGLLCGSVERVVWHCCDRSACVEASDDPDNWRILGEQQDAADDLLTLTAMGGETD